MPIPDYEGETFVAFVDISGFKEMMRDSKKAIQAIDKFYSLGYSVIRNNQGIHGLFVSDCAVLFVHDARLCDENLSRLLKVIETLNREMVEYNIMLKTSIAYGQFSYHQKIECKGIEKNPICGNAYLTAFLDNQLEKPKLKPGWCRVIKQGLPENIRLPFIEKMEETEKYWNYFWMVHNNESIAKFKLLFNGPHPQKYEGMLEVLKHQLTINMINAESINHP